MCCVREEDKEGFYEAWRWWQSMLDKWQPDNETAGQWLKRGHESQERGQDGVCLFTMHKHKVRSDFSYLSFQLCYFLMLWSLVLSNSMAPDMHREKCAWVYAFNNFDNSDLHSYCIRNPTLDIFHMYYYYKYYYNRKNCKGNPLHTI